VTRDAGVIPGNLGVTHPIVPETWLTSEVSAFSGDAEAGGDAGRRG
jgi:hypothetical protein